jgi:hypothetical protein
VEICREDHKETMKKEEEERETIKHEDDKKETKECNTLYESVNLHSLLWYGRNVIM